MIIKKNVLLSELTTMRLGGAASFVAEIESKSDIEAAYIFAEKNQLDTYILGGGSNTIAPNEGFDGLVLINKITGIDLVRKPESNTVTLKIGSGEILDNVVNYSTKQYLTGIESLSSVPGTIGGASIQNSGAYGQEIADSITSIEVYDKTDKKFKVISKKDINYGYRKSIFNSEYKGRYFVTTIYLSLRVGEIENKLYPSLQRFLDENNFSDRSPQTIRMAVMSIRANKLPDPKVLPSAGSFFKNVTVTPDEAEKLRKKFPNIKTYVCGENFEIPSGWLIEQAGLKGKTFHGMQVSDKAALILINKSAKSYDDLAAARSEIISKVEQMFGITLEQEPEEI